MTQGGSDSLWAAITEEVVAYKQPVQAVLDKQAAHFNDAVGDAVDRLSSCLGTRPRGGTYLVNSSAHGP